MLRSQVIAPEAAERALAKIERNAQAQARLVEDLLEVSRMTAGKVELHRQPIDLVRIVNDAIEAVRPDAEKRRVTIEKPPAPSPLPTIGDPDRLQQVVWNLVSNAVKFSDPGSHVTVSVDRHDQVDEIVVRDNGAGIDLSSCRTSSRRSSGDSSTTRAHGGLGLGLAIVRQLTEMHGGEMLSSGGLGAARPSRSGCRCTCRGAHKSADVGGAATFGARVAIRHRRARRGRRSGRGNAPAALSRAGARVYAAASAEEALALAASHIPTAVVSDIAMPGYDGYTMMEKLPASRAAMRIAIALSAHAGDSALQRARSRLPPSSNQAARPFGVIESCRTARRDRPDMTVIAWVWLAMTVAAQRPPAANRPPSHRLGSISSAGGASRRRRTTRHQDSRCVSKCSIATRSKKADDDAEATS
jgi:CheY-like chemotaxis protein